MELMDRYLPYLLQGAVITVEISALSIVFACALGLAGALLRLSRFLALRWVAIAYINVFRTTPLLVQLLWIYFALPTAIGFNLTAFTACVIALSLYTGAYLAEVFRAGIGSVEIVQREAGYALGMTHAVALRRVILPLAIQRMLPAVVTVLVTLIKDSSLASVIAVAELTRRGQAVVQQTLDPVLVFTIVGVLYLVINIPLMWGIEFLYGRRQTDDASLVRAAGGRA
jgi:polar amino acid transport system permease protein